MNDTTPAFEAIVSARYRSMTPEQRLRAAASLFDTARAIVDSSLPASLTPAERRLAQARRMYGDELSPAALRAHAEWTKQPQRGNDHALDPR